MPSRRSGDELDAELERSTAAGDRARRENGREGRLENFQAALGQGSAAPSAAATQRGSRSPRSESQGRAVDGLHELRVVAKEVTEMAAKGPKNPNCAATGMVTVEYAPTESSAWIEGAAANGVDRCPTCGSAVVTNYAACDPRFDGCSSARAPSEDTSMQDG